MPGLRELLTLEQKEYIRSLIIADNAETVEQLLQDGIKNEKDPSGDLIYVDEYTNTVPSLSRNMLHDAISWSAVKCIQLLINAPHSWNVDKPEANELTAMYLAECNDNPWIAIMLAPLTQQLRPYPAQFTVINGEQYMQYICNFLLWPQLALIDQPWHMKSHLERIIERTIYSIEKRYYDSSERAAFRKYHGENYGFLCELLLANVELVNCDVTGDNRLPYESIIGVDSSLMWPIMPIAKEFVDEHIHCTAYPQCLRNREIPSELFDIWKFHRFGRPILDSETSESIGFVLTPLSLKEYSRLIIRRQMVRHVEPLNGNTDEYMFPNQVILLRYLHLPSSLKTYMMFTDIPTSPDFSFEFGYHFPRRAIYRGGIPSYGPGIVLHGSCIPDSFKSLYP